MKKIYAFIIGLMLLVASCEVLDEITRTLSDEEIIEGLKTALNVGTDSASGNLSKINGYYNNPLVKIPLPSEAEAVRNLINSNSTLAFISLNFGLDDKFEDVIKSVNRAAENAASEAAPIFKGAVTNLTISQGWDILNGIVPESTSAKSSAFDSTAATQYLKAQTFVSLTNLYAPKINTSLGAVLIGGKSASDTWTSLTSSYNSFRSRTDVSIAVSLAGINLPSSINSDLGGFCTQKALDGLFYKVGGEEKKIRKDPLAWASTAVGGILEKVFGSGQ